MGCISQSEILLEDIILIDKNDKKGNYILKPGLRENNDYIIIKQEFWEYLF